MFPRVWPRRFCVLCLLLLSVARAWAHNGAPETLPSNAIVPGGFVSNFRLTDHTGTTRELFYESPAKAIVLVFTGPGHPRATQTAAALQAMRARFSAAEVVIWQIDSNAGRDRTAIAAAQAATGSTLPVLVDHAQLVATEFSATHQLESFVINPATWMLVYRGPLDNADPASTAAATINYASDAAAAVLAGRAVATPLVAMPTNSVVLDLPTVPVPDYASEIGPLFVRSCVQCHSPGNIAPFVFSKHADLELRANQIRGNLLTRKMTPWHADSQFGVFSNSAALTPAEIVSLYAWCRAGAPRGAGADPLLSVPAVSSDWPLGTPDLVLNIARQTLPATGLIPYRYVTVNIPTTTDRWLRAAVVRPGNAAAVHHALVFEGNQLDILLGNLGGLGGFFAGYAPGMPQTWYPDGSGKLLKKNSQITFQMHYTATGKAETDQTQIGFYFTETPPTRELLTKSAFTTDISIAPRVKEYTREASYTPSTTKDVMLYELNPHMHYRGKHVKYEALYPDGSSEVLLNVPKYDFHWQSTYRLAQPKRLPAGTTIRVRGAFDNSPENRDNPDPAASVSFGEQTNDEMFIGYINYAELPDRTVMPPRFAGNVAARARIGEPFSLSVAATGNVTAYRATGLPAGLTLNPTTGVVSGTPQVAERRTLALTAENPGGTAAVMLDLVVTPVPGAPAVAALPASQSLAVGGSLTLTAAATGNAPITYQWRKDGVALAGATASALTIANAQPAQAGNYDVVVTNAIGSVTSAPLALSVGLTSRLNNVSVRTTLAANQVVIVGLTMVGGAKPVLVRAAGPGLAQYGVTGAMADPRFTIYNGASAAVAANDNWSGSSTVAAASQAVAAFPLAPTSLDAALVQTIEGGNTVHVSGPAAGNVLVEAYDTGEGRTTRLTNISARNFVGVGDDVMIAGFSLDGAGNKTVLIRAVGPSLANYGVPGLLADPKLELYNGSQVKIAENDTYAATLAGTFTSVGAFALIPGSKDAALVVNLPSPGVYTVKVSGADGGTGNAIVELYELP